MEREITATFNSKEQYFITQSGKRIDYTKETGPYELMLGALALCFYRTFVTYEEEIEFEEIIIKVGGNKRKTVPTTLEETKLFITAKGVKDSSLFERAIERTAQSCSIYQTISQVSHMEIEIQYIYE